jgi:hypothetical protein
MVKATTTTGPQATGPRRPARRGAVPALGPKATPKSTELVEPAKGKGKGKGSKGATTGIIIDEEFRSLIPPLSAEELAQLESNILEHERIDPLVVWVRDEPVKNSKVLLDGHNRHDICQRHGIGFETVEIGLEDRDEAKIWIIQNQLGRRNLEPYVKVEMALKLKPMIEAQAKARQEAGGKEKVPQTFAEPLETREEIAKVAGVSRETVRKVETIQDEADEETKAKLRTGEMSIHAAYQATRPAGTDEPIEVQRARRDGHIPAGAEVDISTDAEDSSTPDPPEVAPAEGMTDEAWLNTLPARSKLTDRTRKMFEADALFYRRTKPHRDEYRKAVRPFLKGVTFNGRPARYAFQYLAYISMPGPESWLACLSCNGTGYMPGLTDFRCTDCHTSGYHVKGGDRNPDEADDSEATPAPEPEASVPTNSKPSDHASNPLYEDIRP